MNLMVVVHGNIIHHLLGYSIFYQIKSGSVRKVMVGDIRHSLDGM